MSRNNKVSDFAICAAVLLFALVVVVGIVHAIHDRKNSPQAQAAAMTYELIANCKGAFMRRSRESVVRRSDGKLFYRDSTGSLTGIAAEADIDEVCKTVDKKF